MHVRMSMDIGECMDIYLEGRMYVCVGLNVSPRLRVLSESVGVRLRPDMFKDFVTLSNDQ